MTCRILAFLFISWLSVSNLHAQDRKARIQLVENSLLNAEDTSKTLKNMNIRERMKVHNAPSVSIAVINNGKLDWAKAYGYANLSIKKRANTRTIYQVASLSKSVNAFYLMKLAQEGKISLDHDIRAYLKTWKISENEFSLGKEITIRGLLSHTAGFSTSGFMGYLKTDSLPTINQTLNGERPANNDAVRTVYPVNSKYHYSGGGTTISRKIIEDHIGQNYDSLLNANVLLPLKMANSTYQQLLPGKLNNFATAYDGGTKEVAGKYNLYPELAADGLWSTPSDIAKFVIDIQRALAGKPGAILSKQSATEMLTPVLDTRDIALGAFIIDRGGEKYFVHLGGNRGFQSIYYGSFTTGKGVVITVNSDNVHPTLIREIVNSVATVYQWEDFFPNVSK